MPDASTRDLRALAPDPTMVNVRIHLGNALHRRGDFQGATQSLRRVLQLDPGAGGAWRTLGVVRFADGDVEGARAALERSLELRQGGDEDEWLLLGLICLRQGREEQARQRHGRALERGLARSSR